MAFFQIFLLCLPLVFAGEMSITGRVDQPCPGGAPCAERPPMQGHTLDIWNCNGKCTKMTMKCGFDRFEIAVETDRTSQIFVYALGDGSQAHNASEGHCENMGRSLPYTALADGRDDRPKYTYADISFDKCGTVAVNDVTNDLNSNNVIFKNELDIVEFLQVQKPVQGKTAIYQASHTRVKVECCYNPPECIAECDGPEDPEVTPLADCDVNDFSLTCNTYADPDSESYCCDIHLSKKFNTEDIGWVLDSCEGTDVNGTGDTVILYQNGVGPNSNLQVVNNIIGEGDTRQHTISGPWFQFNRPESDLGTHYIGITCTVRLVNSTELQAYQPTATSGCPAVSGPPRLGAGYFQAGQLTLIKP